MSNPSNFHKVKGNAGIIGLAALAIIAIGAFAYMATRDGGESAPASVETASGAAETGVSSGEQTAAADPAKPADGAAQPTIKPGNPVVAKVEGKDITRADVLNFIQSLPPQTRQMPIEQLFPLAVDQVVNTQVVMDKTKDVRLDGDPEVKKQMALAKDQIMRSVYLQKEVDKQVDDQKLKNAYGEYVKTFPDVTEVKASHILVKDDSKARELIGKLNAGEDFAKLAEANSTDGTAKNGGALGYFAEKEVVPAFAKAAFATAPGSYTKSPVKTEFGYHIIKVEDKRKRPPPDFETAKPFLEVQVRRQILEAMIQDWRKGTKVELFDINGDKPAAPAGKSG